MTWVLSLGGPTDVIFWLYYRTLSTFHIAYYKVPGNPVVVVLAMYHHNIYLWYKTWHLSVLRCAEVWFCYNRCTASEQLIRSQWYAKQPEGDVVFYGTPDVQFAGFLLLYNLVMIFDIITAHMFKCVTFDSACWLWKWSLVRCSKDILLNLLSVDPVRDMGKMSVSE